MDDEPTRSLADANTGNTAHSEKHEVPKQPEAVQQPVNKQQEPVRPTAEKPQAQVQKPQPQQQAKPQKPKKHYGSKLKNLLKKLHPIHIKAKLSHYRFEYGRVLHLTRKPTRDEYKELAIMVVVGTFIIGAIGFVVQMIIQYS